MSFPSAYSRMVWPVYGVAAGITFAVVGLIDAHAEPVVALVAAGVAAILGITQSLWRGSPRDGGRR